MTLPRIVADGVSEPLIRRAFQRLNELVVRPLSRWDLNIPIVDGGDAELTTGLKAHVHLTADCRILEATLMAAQAGSLKVDVWAAAWDSFPPADGDSICGGYELEISGGQNAVASVANWSPVLAADTVLAFNVDSCTTVQRATVHLRMELN